MAMASSEFGLEHTPPDTLMVSGALNFDTAAGVLAGARAHGASTPLRVLDLSGVTSADSAGLACVLVLMADAHARNAQLDVRNVPEGLKLLARVSDADGLLGAS